MYQTTKRRPSHRWLAVWHLLGVLAILASLGQSPAVAAVPSGNGVWIEVCGGDGTKLVQVDNSDSDETPNKCCINCKCCFVSIATIGGLPPQFFGSSSEYTKAKLGFAHDIANITGAEQYWAANRGPPKASKENMMMYPASLMIKGPVVTTSFERSLTWL